MRKNLILLPLVAALCAACVSGTKRYYRDQPAVSFTYSPETDVAVMKKKKIAIVPVSVNNQKIKKEDMVQIINNAAGSANKYNFTIVDSEKVNKVISSDKGKTLISLIGAASGSFGPDVTAAASTIGKQLQADYLFFALVSSADDFVMAVYSELDPGQKEEVDGYYWPAFEILQMKIEATANVQVNIFDVAGLSWEKELRGSHMIRSIYDTDESYMTNIRNIHEENRKRVEENHRRDIERKARDAEKARRKKKTTFGDILDDITYEPLKKISEKLKMNSNKYADSEKMYAELFAFSFTDAFNSYNARFAGETIKGNCINGYGEYKLASGDVFKGNWENGRASGRGFVLFADGGYFSGTFTNGFASGFGISSSPAKGSSTKNMFEGYYLNGEKNGVGIYYYNAASPIFLVPVNYNAKYDNSYLNGAKNAVAKNAVAGKVYRVNCLNGEIKSWVELADEAAVQKERETLFRGINFKEYQPQ